MKMLPQQSPGSPCTPPPPRGPNRGAPQHSGSRFSTDASTTDVSEQPKVTMDEWWLSRVEGHDRRIAVAGFFERKEALHAIDAPIAKRYDPWTLETDDGTVLFLYGFFSAERTLDNGYSVEACENFLNGFPHWWENWNVCYPKMMSSQTGSQLISPRSSNLVEDNDVPAASMVEYNIDEGMVGIDSASRINEGCQKIRGHPKKLGKDTAMQSLEKGCQNRRGHLKKLGKDTDIQSLEKGCQKRQGRPKKLGKDTAMQSLEKGKQPVFGKLHHGTKLPTIRSPIPYGKLLSPLTRGKAQSFSVATPESLKLKKTRSGRVVVPPLNYGYQNIIYDRDGSISAIVRLNSPTRLKGSTCRRLM